MAETDLFVSESSGNEIYSESEEDSEIEEISTEQLRTWETASEQHMEVRKYRQSR
jgi:hypothetical protein